MTASAADIRRHCKVLNLTPPATPAEVKTAYRDMVLIWHPDRFTANPRLQAQAELRMREINAAYEVLCDGVGAQPTEQAVPRNPWSGPRRPPPPTVPAWFEILARRLAGLHRRIPLPASVPWPLIALSAMVFVAVLIFGSVWLLKPRPAIETPISRIEPGAPAPLPSTAPTPTLPRPASAEQPGRQTIKGEPQNGAELITSRDGKGAGVLRIGNAADLDAAVTLAYTASPGTALRTVYVRAGQEARIAGIGPGEYIVQAEFGRRWRPSTLTFAESRSRALPVGPIVFVHVQGSGGIKGDEYEVVLSPRR